MNEKLNRILNDPRRVPIITGVTAFGIGVGLGYILGRSRKVEVELIPNQLEMDFTDRSIELDRIREEVEEMREAREARQRPAPVVIDESQLKPSVIDETEAEILTIENGVIVNSEQFIAERLTKAMMSSNEPDEVVMQSVFAENNDDWDYEKEIKTRSAEQPYVIHKDEFYADELGYTQTTLCYYAGDNIMADEEDAPVYNHERVTGPLNFGHGSSDPNVFHVRNDKRRAEYEILFHEGLYSEEVLGHEIEHNQRVQKDIRHADYRKFKLE